MSMDCRYKIALLLNRDIAEKVIASEDLDFLQSFADTTPIDQLPNPMTVDFMKQHIHDADACITCWGTPALSEEILASASHLKMIGHMAGTARAVVTDTVWDRDITVTSAAPIIARDVAETTLALILNSLKRFWEARDITRSGEWQSQVQYTKMKRLHGLRVGVVGASSCGKNLIKLLKAFDTTISLYDPYVSEEDAKALGVHKVSLPELMAQNDVVTVHAPQLPSTFHMINGEMFSLLQDNALFINTSRGSLVDEHALIEALKTGRFNACLDVTDPEPPPADHPFRSLDNVILTPHIAGGHTINGRMEQGHFIIQQLYKFFITNEPLEYVVKKEMLEYMA